jgi:hypothetical protein
MIQNTSLGANTTPKCSLLETDSHFERVNLITELYMEEEITLLVKFCSSPLGTLVVSLLPVVKNVIITPFLMGIDAAARASLLTRDLFTLSTEDN